MFKPKISWNMIIAKIPNICEIYIIYRLLKKAEKIAKK